MVLAQIWSVLGLLTVLQNVLPSRLVRLLHGWWEGLKDFYSPNSYVEIPEFNGYCGVDMNELYRSVQIYLNSLHAAAHSRRVSVSRAKNSSHLSYTLAPDQTMEDIFAGARLWWTHNVDPVPDSLDERRSFTLKMKKPDRTRILGDYLEHVAYCAEEYDSRSRDRKLYTNNGHGSHDCGWTAVPFRHPATFSTLALDPELMDTIKADLDSFAQGKDFYHRVGRAWKRGYLLHGPPGTGKSSLIAAMANYLHYDVYDLELTKVTDNSELRALLIQTTNKSIIVIEDIDCSLDLTDRLSKFPAGAPRRLESTKSVEHLETDDSRVTLSGLLNFTDGLWSCCGEERIIVFTTNHKDNVDPALIRSGRMDMHILLSNCGFPAFKCLAFNYLGIEEHNLFPVIEQSIQAGGALTPAEISEILIKHKHQDPFLALKAVVSALHLSIVRKCEDFEEPFEEEEVPLNKGEEQNADVANGDIVDVFVNDRHADNPRAVRNPKTLTWQRKVRYLIRTKKMSEQRRLNQLL
ncbi:hypothetical protein SUGI_0190960 [Cryptomeria japonica]|uniref:AAA-ATPase At4g25835 n=1 Tax=Cryptomeria japonica TaxID=3369 RepID=UPI002408AFE4|nr:AAA-ATPase At4g25835 [Cryptomeria japonica]GLJ12446.1 hypothetical protein SUGI_0190960 [Cryptomeria japonica]